MVRAFVAIDLSPEIREAVEEAQETIRKCNARLSLVDPDIVHITVKFLGEVRDSQVEIIREALQQIKQAPFSIEVTGIAINSVRNPRVVWGTILDQGECGMLNENVECVLGPLGFPRESRKYTPHATVARVKDFDQSLLQAIRPLATKSLGKCMVNGFSLKKSTLTPKGPVYENIMEVTW